MLSCRNRRSAVYFSYAAVQPRHGRCILAQDTKPQDTTAPETAAVAELREAEAIVVSDPAVMDGEPAIAGTRVPVYMIGEIAAELGIDEAHATYPFLTRRMVELALVYVKSVPRPFPPRLPELGRQNGPTRYGTIQLARK